MFKLSTPQDAPTPDGTWVRRPEIAEFFDNYRNFTFLAEMISKARRLVMVECWLGRLGSMIGFATCHQLPERSLLFSNEPFFLCARCNGLYVGCALALCYWILCHGLNGLPETDQPQIPLLILLGIPGLAYYLDIWTSYTGLRETTNSIRLATGLFFGMSLITLFQFLSTRESPSEAKRKPRSISPLHAADLLFLGGLSTVMFFSIRSAHVPFWLNATLVIAGVMGFQTTLASLLISRLLGRKLTVALISLVIIPFFWAGLGLFRFLLTSK